MGGSLVRISGKPGADRGELSTDEGEFSADTGKLLPDTGKFSADTGKLLPDTGKFSADTGKLPGCLTKQPVLKMDGLFFVFVSLVGLLYDEFFVSFFQR